MRRRGTLLTDRGRTALYALAALALLIAAYAADHTFGS